MPAWFDKAVVQRQMSESCRLYAYWKELKTKAGAKLDNALTKSNHGGLRPKITTF